MIYVVNKKRNYREVQEEYPGAYILDVTSYSDNRFGRILSPFFPHGNVPIPFTPDTLKATCVEAVWQGLKVFQYADVDFSMFRNATMRNLKRTVRNFGNPLGHRKGAYGKEILGYYDARRLIYLPTYKWVLDNVEEVHNTVKELEELSKNRDIVLLDFNTNTDLQNLTYPLSHAGLIKLYIEKNYPE